MASQEQARVVTGAPPSRKQVQSRSISAYTSSPAPRTPTTPPSCCREVSARRPSTTTSWPSRSCDSHRFASSRRRCPELSPRKSCHDCRSRPPHAQREAGGDRGARPRRGHQGLRCRPGADQLRSSGSANTWFAHRQVLPTTKAPLWRCFWKPKRRGEPRLCSGCVAKRSLRFCDQGR